MFNELLKSEISRFGGIGFLEEKLDLVRRDVSIAEVLQSKRQILGFNLPILISVQLAKQALNEI